MRARVESLGTRAAARIVTSTPGDCWTWIGKLDRDGYGRLDRMMAHRFVYEALVGPIETGLDLDHLCRVRDCVNPEHLEPVTRSENNKRKNASKTHCKHGHEFTAENTRASNGKRECRACQRMASARYISRKRNERAAS